jgi:XTP/dITP diphosphohydrolase
MKQVPHVVIATGNPGKVKDFQHLFDHAGLTLKVDSMAAYGGMPPVEEVENTFKGNALLKAWGAKAALPESQLLWVLADDSGLSVDVLDGAPGVHSAYYAGPNASDVDNRNKLILALGGVPPAERTAAFTCHLCLLSPSGEEYHFVGRMEGTIASEVSGSQGFGYDPLFIPSGGTQTWGSMDPSAKNHDSHRARATSQMIAWFQELLCS